MDHASASSDVLSLSARVTLVLAHLAERRRQLAIYRKTHAELSAMADRDLVDIGVRRGMIADIAREAALSA